MISNIAIEDAKLFYEIPAGPVSVQHRGRREFSNRDPATRGRWVNVQKYRRTQTSRNPDEATLYR